MWKVLLVHSTLLIIKAILTLWNNQGNPDIMEIQSVIQALIYSWELNFQTLVTKSWIATLPYLIVLVETLQVGFPSYITIKYVSDSILLPCCNHNQFNGRNSSLMKIWKQQWMKNYCWFVKYCINASTFQKRRIKIYQISMISDCKELKISVWHCIIWFSCFSIWVTEKYIRLI